MAEETTLLTKILADVSGFVSPLKHAEEAVEGFFKGLGKGGFAGLSEGLASLAEGAGPLLAIAGAGIAIHEAFKLVGESLEETTKWNLEAGKLSRQLQMTAQDASVLANALEDHGISVESYTTAQNFMIRALRNGSEGFQHLGVATRDSSGHLRPANEIMQDAIEKLNEMPDTTKKAIVGQELFGKSWLNSQEITRVTKEVLADTQKQMEELGTVVTPEAEKATRKYTLALADVHDVVAAFGINLGNKLMPVLTDFLHWVGEVGTRAVILFREALDFLGEAFSFLGQLIGPLVSVFGDALTSAVRLVVDWFSELYGMVNDVLLQIPGLGRLLEWLEGLWGSVGGAGGIFTTILRVMATVLTTLIGVFSILTGVVSGFATLVLGTFGTLAKALLEFSFGDYKKAGDVLASGMQQTFDKVKAKSAEIETSMGKLGKGLGEIWRKNVDEGGNVADTNGPSVTMKKAPGGGGDIETKDKSGEMVKKWKEKLDEIKLEEQNWFTWDNQKELDFWEAKLKLTKKGTEARREVIALVAKLQKDIHKEERDAELQHDKNVSDEQTRAYELDLAEADRASKRKAELLKANAAEETEKVKTKSDVASVNADEQEKLQIGLRSSREQLAIADRLAEQLAELRQADLVAHLKAEDAKLKAVRDRIAEQRRLAGGNQLEQEKLNGEEVKEFQETEKRKAMLLDAEEDAKQKDIVERNKRKQAIQDAADKTLAQSQKELSKKIEGYMEPFVSGFQQGIKKILDGSLSLGDAIKGMGKMLVSAMGDMISKMVSDWISGLAKELAQWIAVKTTELFFHKTVEEQKADASLAGTGKVVAAKAAEAGASGAASAAATPVIGWLIAIPVMLGIVAAVMGLMGGVKSAAGGFDVPSGMNPMTQLHAEEMVLPASVANTVRSAMAAHSGGGSDSGPPPTAAPMSVSLTIPALDGRSVSRVMRSNHPQLVKVFRELARDGKGRRG